MAITTIAVRHISNHVKALEQCVLMFENIELLLRSQSLPITDIFIMLQSTGNYKLLIFIDEICNEIKNFKISDKSILNSLSNRKLLGYFENSDIDCLKTFFSSFGKSDINGQILNCKLFKEIFKKKYEKSNNEKNEKIKINTVIIMGLTFGILIIIL